jgi:PAS domain S-box-containing protein
LRSLVGRLLIIAGLALVPALAFQAMIAADAQRVRQQVVRDEALRLVNLVSSEQRQVAEGARQMLTALGNLSSVRSEQPDQCNSYFEKLLREFPRYASAASIGLDGRVICYSNKAGAGLNLADRAFFRRALETQGFVVGDHVIGRGTGVPSVHFAQPYQSADGRPAGVVAVALDLRWLQSMLDELPLPEGATASITDRSGTVLARRPDPDLFAGRAAPPFAQDMLRDARAGVQEVAGFDGRTRIFGYSPWSAAPQGLGIAVGLDPEVSLAALARADRHGQWLLAASIGLGLLVTLVAGQVLVRRPVRRMLAVARRWQAGDFAARTGLAADRSEFGRLGVAFDAVAEAAEARERALRAALESTGDSVFLLSPDWRFTYLNRHATAQIAEGRNLLGRVVWEVFPEAVGGPLWEAYQRCMTDRVPTAAEQHYVPHGRTYTARAFPADGGGISVFFRDVTGERAAAIALAEERARLAATYDAAPVGLALVDRDLRFLEANSRLAAYAGRPVEDIVGRTLREVLPGSADQLEPAHRHVLLTGEPVERVELEVTAGGPERRLTLLAACYPVRSGDAVTGVSAAVVDITEQKEAQAELHSLTRRLEERVRAEVAAREEAQARAAQAERMQALGQLAGGIAHDFNNVLQAVQGGARLIERRSGDAASVTRFARMVIEASERGAAVTRRLLAFARRGELRAEPVDAGALLLGLREVLGHTLGSSIAVRVEIGAGLPSLMADKGQLETVLVNLATNARDAMPQGGTLTLSAMAAEAGAGLPAELRAGRYVALCVTDTGTGMEPSVLARVFEPFFTTKPRGQGTGLGLPMAKGFAEQSGGAVLVESAPGQGTRILLWLPAATQEVHAPQAGRIPAAPGLHPASARRLLVVDDEAAVRETLAAGLEDAGFAVLPAESGAEALALLDAGEVVDALVTDLTMPGMTGLTLITEAQSRRPNLPAVLVTGYAGDGAQLAVSGALSGAFSLLRKPVSAMQVADRIEALLESRTEPSA